MSLKTSTARLPVCRRVLNTQYSVLSTLRFPLPLVRSTRATATVETAIVLPLYMLVLLGLLFFGYATLYRQRQTKAAAYAAWMPGEQSRDDVAAQFWNNRVPEELTLNVSEYASWSDDYYGNEVRRQITYSLPGGGLGDTFDRERIAVSLWNYALGETTQCFVWDPEQGIVERMQTNFDSIAQYLNAHGQGAAIGGGFVLADDANSPVIDAAVDRIAGALNGPAATGHWLERRHSTMNSDYKPYYFNIIGLQDHPADTMDLTGRGGGVRLAAGEKNIASEYVLQQAENMFGAMLPEVD